MVAKIKLDCVDKTAELTTKQRLFCDEYILDMSAYNAAIRAGYSERTAKAASDVLLSRISVQTYINNLIDARSKRKQVTSDKVLAELAKMAFTNVKDFYDKEGNLRPIHELSDENASAIEEFAQEKMMVDGQEVVKRKYKLNTKLKALELIGKHLKMFTDKVEITSDEALFNLEVNFVNDKTDNPVERVVSEQ